MGDGTVSRLDWERGRFSVNYESAEISAALQGYQSSHGDAVDYYRFLAADSGMGDLYDEGQRQGRVFQARVYLPVLHVLSAKGPNSESDIGAYYNNVLHVSASYDHLSRTGITLADIRHQLYLSDRIVYDDDVYKVTGMEILGQVQRRDLIVAVQAVQLKPDELVDDLQFATWASRTTDPLGG
jgi:hypothetical protein